MLNINQVCGIEQWEALGIRPVVCINVNGKAFDFHGSRVWLWLGAFLIL